MAQETKDQETNIPTEETQERYHNFILRMLKETRELEALCDDCAEYGSDFCEHCLEEQKKIQNK